MANLSLTLQCGSTVSRVHRRKRVTTMDGVYPCKTCHREFSSFQALGGHRTSHKRPRARAEGLDLVLGPIKKVKTSHECTICGAGFTMGQALGGHMRRHRPIVDPVHKRLGSNWASLDDGVHEEGLERRLLPLFV